MDIKIKELSESELQKYFNTESLDKLHSIKLYLDDKYYNTGEDTISDWDYDMLKETLKRRDPDYIVPIGYKIRENENKTLLPYHLGSMEKYTPNTVNELLRWVEKNKSKEYIIEDKLDGVSCLVILTNGKIKLYTRGNGVEGSDISYLAQYFSTIPKKTKETLAIRGELIMKESVFKEKYSKKYANPRNMVAGLIGAKTIREGLKDIDFIAYEIVGDEEMPKPSEQLDHLNSIGFNVVRHEIVDKITIDTLAETFLSFKTSTEYEIDGIIVQADKPYDRNDINSSGNPNYAFAFKMRLGSNLKNTEVVEVEWNVSKWGILKPRVRVKPISLGGVTITYATGFNAKYINDNKIGPGSVITITRSGDVIPYIVDIITLSKEADMPEIPFKWNETKVDIITEEYGELMCIKLISSFFAKLKIKHVAEANVAKMYNTGFDSLLKILGATEKNLKQIDTFGDKLAERTYKNIHEGLQNVSISTVLGASGVFGFGIGTKKVDSLFKDFPEILEVYKDLSKEELYERVLSIEGFAEKSAKQVTNSIEYADKFIQEISKYATFKIKKKVSNNLSGMKIVMSGFRDADLEEEIDKRGGKITSAVSKNTSILILPSKEGKKTGKVEKAEKEGVRIMDKLSFITEYIK